MENNNEIKKNSLSLKSAARYIGIKSEVLVYQIENGKLNHINMRILKSDCEKIKKQREKYIGIKSYIMTHDSDTFIAKYAKHRSKYIDFLEINDYFGIQRYMSDEMLFALPDAEEFYFDIEDISFLDFNSIDFFNDYGLSEKEKVERIIKKSHDCPVTVKNLKRYIESSEKQESIYTPAFTHFVDIILSTEDVINITDEDIISLFEAIEIDTTKNYICDFLKFVSLYEKTKYHKVSLPKKESNSAKAYSYDKYVDLAILLFNREYDDNHELTQKALNNHLYAELWMFLSLHYVCGWRGANICKNWVYLDLKNEDNPFGINPTQIKEGILTNKYSEKTYIDVALYSIKKLEMLFNLPSKTHNAAAGKLRSMITPDLRVFFGKMILIAEYHHFISGEGYMKEGRISQYENWTILRSFFGEEAFKITGRHNISSTRLNKSYLQGIEMSARYNGNTALVAHIVASYARNHMDVNTTAIYLKDHGLSGETAEVVLYMMMQRGVMGVYLYQALISAFPGQFEKLSMKEQTELMQLIPVSAYEIESIGSSLFASSKIHDNLIKADTEEPKAILKAMYAIGQGEGKSKDEGIFCKKKALGFSCVNPTYESCIANMCPYHVFSSEGIPALIKVIKEYSQKEDPTGTDKYINILKKKIIPGFQEIINAVIKDMTQKEKDELRVLISEGLI